MNHSYTVNGELIENYRLICAAEPDNIENWLILGRCLVDAQQYEEAEKALTKIFEEGRFFSFKNGLPRLRFKTIWYFFKNRVYFARAYADLAAVSLYHGNLAEAERQLILALSEFEKAGLDDEYARAANRLGMIYRLAGAYESAEDMHFRAKSLAEQHGWPLVLAESLGNLGMVYEGKDRFEAALERHREALDIYAADPHHSFEAACLKRQIGLCLLRSGKHEEALETLSETLKNFKEEGSLVFQSRLYNDLSMTYQTLNRADEAIDAAREAVKTADGAASPVEQADNRVLLACLKMEADINDPALEKLLRKAIEIYRSMDRKVELANASATLGLVYLRRGEWQRAESLFRDSLHLEEMLQRCFGMASDYGNLGLIAQKTGRYDKAADYWNKASLLFEKGGETSLSDHFRQLYENVRAAPPAVPPREG